MKVNLTQKIQSKGIVKNFSLNFLSQLAFHLIALTVFENMLTLFLANTALNIPVFITAYTEWRRGPTVDGDVTKHSFAHCKHYHTEVFWRCRLQAEDLIWNSFHMVMLTVVDNVVNLYFAGTEMTAPVLVTDCTE